MTATTSPSEARPHPAARTVRDVLSGTLPAERLGLAHEVLDVLAAHTDTARASGPSGLRRSTLTPDGVPFELAVRASPRGGGVRYIADPGDLRLPPEARLQADMIPSLLRRLGGHADAASRHELLARTLLAPDLLRTHPTRFGTWVSPHHRADGGTTLRVYYNLGPWRRERKLPARALLLGLADRAELTGVTSAARVLPLGLCPAMLGVEYDAGGVTRVKWYLRACRGLSLTRLTRLVRTLDLSEDALRGALGSLLSDAAFPERQVMLYLSHDPAGRVGLNVYLPAHTLGPDERTRSDRVGRALAALGLKRRAYDETRSVLSRTDRTARHTVVGVSLWGGEAALNVYFQP